MILTSLYSPRVATRELLRAISELLAGQVGFGSTVCDDSVSTVDICEAEGRGVTDPKMAVLVVSTPMSAVLVVAVPMMAVAAVLVVAVPMAEVAAVLVVAVPLAAMAAVLVVAGPMAAVLVVAGPMAAVLVVAGSMAAVLVVAGPMAAVLVVVVRMAAVLVMAVPIVAVLVMDGTGIRNVVSVSTTVAMGKNEGNCDCWSDMSRLSLIKKLIPQILKIRMNFQSDRSIAELTIK